MWLYQGVFLNPSIDFTCSSVGKILRVTEISVQTALWWDLRSSCRIVMPNYSPSKWWENDIFSITKAGYWTEYEIKMTVSDFRADSKKVREESTFWSRTAKDLVTIPAKNKHDLLASKSTDGPSRFYFVVSEKIVDKIECPEWAGLKIAKESYGRVYVVDHKKAPKLHNTKIDPAIEEHIKDACYWRYWNTRCDVDKCVRREINRMNLTSVISNDMIEDEQDSVS